MPLGRLLSRLAGAVVNGGAFLLALLTPGQLHLKLALVAILLLALSHATVWHLGRSAGRRAERARRPNAPRRQRATR
jgi:hypothetical protein